MTFSAEEIRASVIVSTPASRSRQQVAGYPVGPLGNLTLSATGAIIIEFDDPFYADDVFAKLLNGFPLKEVYVEFNFEPAQPAKETDVSE